VMVIAGSVSCARMQPIHDKYKSPSLSNSVKLYFDLPVNVYVGLFSDEQCTLGKYGTLVEYDYYTGESVVDGYRAEYAYEGKMHSIDVESNKPQVINFTHYGIKIDSHKGTQITSLCPITYEFTPQSGHDYVAVLKYDDDACAAIIIDLTQSRIMNAYVMAAGLRPARKNCDVYEYYSQYRPRKK